MMTSTPRVYEFPECGRKHYGYGLCAGHNAQRRRGADLTPIRPRATGCAVAGCDEKHRSSGYCNMHYQRYLKGDPGLAGRRRNQSGLGNVSVHGYMRITVDGKSMAEHRWIMEQYLGRKLLPHETVHHKNGDRADNRIENLELWSRSQPSGQRVEDKVAWAIEILNTYCPAFHASH